MFLNKNTHFGLPWWLSGKESTCQFRRHGFDPWSGKISQVSEQRSLCTSVIEPSCLTAYAPQQQKALPWEARTPQQKSSLQSLQLEKKPLRWRRSSTAKNEIKKKSKKHSLCFMFFMNADLPSTRFHVLQNRKLIYHMITDWPRVKLSLMKTQMNTYYLAIQKNYLLSYGIARNKIRSVPTVLSSAEFTIFSKGFTSENTSLYKTPSTPQLTTAMQHVCLNLELFMSPVSLWKGS